MTRVAGWALGALLLLGADALAQRAFSIAASPPYRAGEWIALELDLEVAARAGEITVYVEGAAEPLVSFRASGERTVPPARFPLRLDERGRYEVRFDGRLVQRLELEVRSRGPWPARTWVPEERALVPRSRWELGAWNAAYAPSARERELVDALEVANTDRMLPSAPLALRAPPARWALTGFVSGHSIFGLLCALGVLALGLPKRVRAGLCIACGGAVTIAEVASPESFWPQLECAIVWSAVQSADGTWSYFADELRFGEGELVLDEATWIEPLEGSELSDIRAERDVWRVHHRAGALRRWWPPASTAVREAARDPRSLFAARHGEAFRGLIREGACELLEIGAPREPTRRPFASPRFPAAERSRGALLQALARAYAFGGVRRYAVLPPSRGSPSGGLAGLALSFLDALVAAARGMEVENPNELLEVRSEWYALRDAPEDPFGAPRAPRFLRVIERPPDE